MSKIIDLSRELVNGLPVYPGDEEMQLYQTRFFDKDGYSNHKLQIGMHVGTHIDAPMHMTKNEIHISAIPLDNLIGRGLLIDAVGTEEINLSRDYQEKIQEGDIILINTGFAQLFGTERYFNNHPVITERFAEILIAKKVKAVCVDSPSPDKYPFKVHKMLLENNIYIGENLINIDRLMHYNNYEVFMIPLNIRADGSMARVFARVF